MRKCQTGDKPDNQGTLLPRREPSEGTCTASRKNLSVYKDLWRGIGNVMAEDTDTLEPESEKRRNGK
jgi:hypothetical protein